MYFEQTVNSTCESVRFEQQVNGNSPKSVTEAEGGRKITPTGEYKSNAAPDI